MKKTILLLIGILVFSSCLKNDDINYTYEFLSIKEAQAPTSFTFGQKDTITLKYQLPNGCYSFNSVYYEHQDTVRIVAIRAFVDLDNNCTEAIREKEYKLIVTASQKEDYLFKFYKGKDNDGKNIFEEVVVPVN